jgi:hypothetical protein
MATGSITFRPPVADSRRPGPLWYESIQAAFLAMVVLLLGRQLDIVLKGGQPRRGIQTTALSLPVGVLACALCTAYVAGGPTLASLDMPLRSWRARMLGTYRFVMVRGRG